MDKRKMIWSIILSIWTLMAAQLLSQSVANLVVLVKGPTFVANILAGILYIIIAYLLIKFLCEKYLKSAMSDYNIPSFKVDIKWGIIAVILPLIVMAFYILFVPGSFSQNDIDINSKLNILSTGIFFTGFGAGIVEELVFRGIMMRAIEKNSSKKVAIVAPSVLFGLVHILGMGFNVLSCVLVLLAGTMVGIMFSLIASTTNSIWNSAIVHAFWNMIIIGGGLWIGPDINNNYMYSYVLDTDSFLLTGGEFGIESSVVAVVGYSLVCLIAMLYSKRKAK